MTNTAAKPWLTVIMPVHRGERWIDDALRSLADQGEGGRDGAGIELLILDSSPNSATLDIARRYADRLAIRFLDADDLGTWHAKTNRGVAASRADHICWLHHDDLWRPGRAAAIRAWIDAAPDAVLHLSPCEIVDATGKTLGVWRCPFAGESVLDAATLLERLLVQNFVAAPAPVYRRDAYLACGGLDEQLWYTADWDLWLKLAAQGPVRHHDGVTAAFRVHDSSLTVTGSRDAADFERQMRIVLDRHLPRLARRAPGVRRAGLASIRVNSALAAASAGKIGGLIPAAAGVLSLGPRGVARYVHHSRIIDRLLPRVRAKLAGAL